LARACTKGIGPLQQRRVGFVRLSGRIDHYQSPRGADDLQKLSDEKHNFLRDGFHATTLADEKRCLDLELNG